MGLDGVEIAMMWEESFGISLDDAMLSRVCTPRDAVELIAAQLEPVDGPSFCPTLRAFHLMRSSVRQVLKEPELRVRPGDKLKQFYGTRGRSWFWEEMQRETGIEEFRVSRMLFRSAGVDNAMRVLVTRHLASLRHPGEPWTRGLIRFGVRQAVTAVTGREGFPDDARFVEDLGID